MRDTQMLPSTPKTRHDLARHYIRNGRLRVITEKPSLLTRYETLRRKEFEYLTGLLDTLGQVDGLPADQMDQARDALFHADHPFLIVLMGAFNSGKSSVINALLGQRILETGATPTTNRITILRHGPAVQRTGAGDTETLFYPVPMLERVSLVDTPGLESVFKEHDAATQKFLHRADIVLLVMLATQAMSARSLESLGSLRAYGKRIIIVINQIDLVEPADRETVRSFVAEQSKLGLGFSPEIWLVSAKEALQAEESTPRDEAVWLSSGFAQIENYINEALSDAARVRQKLSTPIQIARNVTTVAVAQVREQQSALDEYRRAAGNVRGQIDAATREQQTMIEGAVDEIDTTFAEGTRRGREAIRDVFDLSRSVGLVLGGVSELIGLAVVARRLGARSNAANAFELRQVDAPLSKIPVAIDKLGPQLEGRDVKDVDDLIRYTQGEIARLPGNLGIKMIGTLDAPTSYDRSILRSARESMLAALETARRVETATIDRTVRNSLVVLGAYELVVFISLIIGAIALVNSQNGNWAILLIISLILGLAGLLVLPIRARLMERAYAARMLAIKTALVEALRKAAGEQIEASARMRRDAVAPFLRLVDAQIALVEKLKTALEAHSQGLIALEKELGTLTEG
jgi:small GTP-binding protein